MWKQVITAVAVAVIVYQAIIYIDWSGFMRRTYNHAPGPCHRVFGIENGSEDMQVLASGLVLISSGLRFSVKHESSKRREGIYLFDMNKPDEPAELVTIKADPKFKLLAPHGINIWTDPATGTVYLYVVSHFPTETIDKFSFDETKRTLTHLRRITGDPNFIALNDIAVVGEDQFYFTNYFYYDLGLELQLGLRWGSLCFFNGSHSSVLYDGLNVPNGVILSRDKKFLYLAVLGDEEIRVFKRHDDNSLTYSHDIKVNTAIDNLDIDTSTGDLWTGAHPVLYKIFAHLGNPVKWPLSPSQVLRIRLDPESKPIAVEEVYSNDGTEISGSSAAVVHGKRLLIGSVLAQTVVCELN